MKFEDHFSHLAEVYSVYRPAYPETLFKYIAEQCMEHHTAWDCGTGNGQAAAALAGYFEHVIASDPSSEQIKRAVKHPRISYLVERAEDISLRNKSIDLVTAAAAAHWLNFDIFYEKVKNILKPEGLIAVWTYNNVNVSDSVDQLIGQYKNEVLKDYWPERFQYVKSGYKTLPFPFKELNPPHFEMTAEWDLNQLAGFLSSWSGTKNYITQKNEHPLNIIWGELQNAWGNEDVRKKVYFPLFVRAGRIE